MSFLVPLIATLAAIGCAWVTVSHLVRVRRGKPWHLDGYWLTAPLYGGACAVCLTVAGLLGVLPGVILAVALLGPAGWMLGDSWWKVRGKDGWVKANRRIGGGLWHQAWGGWAYLRDDAQTIAGLFRAGREPEPPAPSVRAPAPAAVRTVPSVREDGNLGRTPARAEVAAGLESAGVVVPPPWQALAEWVADFEPEDQEDLQDHMAQEAAGLLTFAEACEARAETLLNVPKLHPAYVAGLLEVADQVAEVAASAAMADRRYHGVYGDIEDWHEEGNALPENARNWFGGGAPAA